MILIKETARRAGLGTAIREWGRVVPCSGSRSTNDDEGVYAISAIIFALVAIGHLIRIVEGWQVEIGGMGVPMSVSWIALAVSAVLAIWGVVQLRR